MIQGEIARTAQNSKEKKGEGAERALAALVSDPWLVVRANNHPTDGTQVPTISFA